MLMHAHCIERNAQCVQLALHAARNACNRTARYRVPCPPPHAGSPCRYPVRSCFVRRAGLRCSSFRARNLQCPQQALHAPRPSNSTRFEKQPLCVTHIASTSHCAQFLLPANPCRTHCVLHDSRTACTLHSTQAAHLAHARRSPREHPQYALFAAPRLDQESPRFAFFASIGYSSKRPEHPIGARKGHRLASSESFSKRALFSFCSKFTAEWTQSDDPIGVIYYMSINCQQTIHKINCHNVKRGKQFPTAFRL